jgi:hypothetical protein
MAKEATMNTKTHNHYYQDLNGSVCCEQHIGAYAEAQLNNNANLKKIVTPITTWIRLSQTELNEVASYNSDICDTCHFSK